MTAGRLDGRVAIITGAASGIGLVTAETFVRHGAAVVIADLDAAGGERSAAAISGDEDRALAVTTDITDSASVAAMVAATVDRLGRLDILVNCAAITDSDHQQRDVAVADLDETVWSRTLAVDLLGTMLCCKHAVPHLLAGGGGSIVNVSSNSSLGGDLTMTAYAAAKAGVNSVTRSVATAYGKSRVRCNTVSPGGIRGPSYARNVPPEVQQLMLDQCLLPELGTPQDVADLILFLASEESRYITGQLICVDGGALAHLPHVGAMRAASLTTVPRASGSS